MTATGTGILPSYQRFTNGAPIAFARKSFRSREKCVVILVFLTFGFVCFGTFFFLPDFRAGLSSTDSVYRVYDQIKRAGPEFLLPPPPPMDESPRGLGLVRHDHDSQMDMDPHILDDREKLRAKIESDGDLKVLERPDVRRSSSPQDIKGRGIREDQIGDILLQGFTNSPYIIRGGEDTDRTARERRNKVKENVHTKSIRDSSKEAPSEDCIHDFSNNATNYDNDKVNQLLFKNQFFLPLFGKVIDLPISSALKRPSRSLEHQKQNLCSTRSYTMYPRKGRAIDLQDKHIVNIPGYYQMI